MCREYGVRSNNQIGTLGAQESIEGKRERPCFSKGDQAANGRNMAHASDSTSANKRWGGVLTHKKMNKLRFEIANLSKLPPIFLLELKKFSTDTE